jgi:hypothetical protein
LGNDRFKPDVGSGTLMLRVKVRLTPEKYAENVVKQTTAIGISA